jgi:uncharacterized protein YkwD
MNGLSRRTLFAAPVLLVVGCAEERRPEVTPAFYSDMSRPGASVDHRTAAEIINAYRAKDGLKPLQPDERLVALAAREAQRLAERGEIADGENASLRASLVAAGLRPASIGKSISAGYQTFADAFSGWRGSPHHDRVMRASKATRFGIAAHHRAGSRHRIYWVMLVGE